MKFTNRFASLNDDFYHQNEPAKAPNPSLFLWNDSLASELGIDKDTEIENTSLSQILAGNKILSSSTPLSMAYAGHQFGHFSPQLGDGRAHLLGELTTASDTIVEIQLKGSGTSRYSRGGDGRCALGPAIREFIMSEAMHSLKIPTTRSLAVVTTGEDVYRDSVLPGAVVTRVASSHLRVGSFEYFAAQGRYDCVETLANLALERHYPEITSEGPQKYIDLIHKALLKQIHLITEWMRVGFIHGVMNTDNTTISGETIDYGPCAFMGVYDPQTVFSSIDTQGRYSYGNQPAVVQWNMSRFAECLLPLIDEDSEAAISAIRPIFEAFPNEFESSYMAMLARKVGIDKFENTDKELLSALLRSLKDAKLDYTQFFDQLSYALTSETLSTKLDNTLGNSWLTMWKERLNEEGKSSTELQALMRSVNPVVIPRNHHMERVIKNCIETQTPDSAIEFLQVLKDPYQLKKDTHLYQDLPSDGDSGYQTFCGT